MPKPNITCISPNGTHTPQQILADALSESAEYDQVILVARGKNNDILIGWSDGIYIDHIGMLTHATHYFCHGLHDEP